MSQANKIEGPQPILAAIPAEHLHLLKQEYLSTEQVAVLAGMNPRTVLRHANELDSEQIGHARRYSTEKVLPWLADHLIDPKKEITLRELATALGLKHTRSIPAEIREAVGSERTVAGEKVVDRKIANRHIRQSVTSDASTISGLAELVDRYPSVIMAHIERGHILVKYRDTRPMTLDPVSVFEAVLRFWPESRKDVLRSFRIHKVLYVDGPDDLAIQSLKIKADALFSKDNYLTEPEVMKRLGKSREKLIPRGLADMLYEEWGHRFYPVPGIVEIEKVMELSRARKLSRATTIDEPSVPHEISKIFDELNNGIASDGFNDELFLMLGENLAKILNTEKRTTYANTLNCLQRKLAHEALFDLKPVRKPIVDDNTLMSIRLLKAAQVLRPWVDNIEGSFS